MPDLPALLRRTHTLLCLDGQQIDCTCTWSQTRPPLRTHQPAECPIHGQTADEPGEADPDLDDLFAVAHAFYIGDGDEHGVDAQELVGMLVDALRRSLVGGRPAAPTRAASGILRQQISDAVWRNLGARTSKRAVEATIDELVALLSRSAAEPNEEVSACASCRHAAHLPARCHDEADDGDCLCGLQGEETDT